METTPTFKNNSFLKKQSLIQRTIKPIYEKSWKSYGMYIGVKDEPAIKENRNILLTMTNSSNLSNRHQYLSNEVYKRRTPMKENGKVVGYHEVGERKWKWTLDKIPQYSNILYAWRDVFDFPQVSYGLTAYRREVVVVDSDVDFPSFEKAEETVLNFCKVAGVPTVNYLLRNPTSGHIQFGWTLDKPFESDEFEVYNKLNKRVALAWQQISGYEGDICFNGPSCKNPFYERFESRLYDYTKVSLEEFVKNIAKVRVDNILHVYNPFSSFLSPYIHNERKQATKTMSNYSVKSLKLSSRRDNILKRLDSWILKTSNNLGHLPEEKETLEQAKLLSEEVSKELNKDLLEDSEIKEIVKTCLAFCKKNWHKTGKSSTFGDKARKSSAFMKRLSQFCKALEVRADTEKLTVRQMAEKHCCSIGAVSKYKNMKKEELYSLSKEVERFLEYCNGFTNLDVEYVEKREACKKALEFYTNITCI